MCLLWFLGFGNVVDVKINRKGVTRDLPVCIGRVSSCCMHGDHLSGKPGNLSDFDSCQGFYKKSGKSGRKYCLLHICIGMGI